MKTCLCPKCNTVQAEVCADEVDLGVGTQVHIFGYDCPVCGQLVVLGCCGGVEKHAAWCNEARGN